MCKSRSNLGFAVYLIHLLELSLLIFCYVKEFESIRMAPGNKYFWLYNQIKSKLFRLLRYICCEESFQKICLYLTGVTKVKSGYSHITSLQNSSIFSFAADWFLNSTFMPSTAG